MLCFLPLLSLLALLELRLPVISDDNEWLSVLHSKLI